ncbi:hypothetical protein, partial [Mycobacterium tuberculosis]
MNAQWKVLWAEAATDREEWIGLWSASAERHPFAHPDVCSLLRAGGGQLAAAVMTVGDGYVLYPFFLREIDAELTAAAGGERMFD